MHIILTNLLMNSECDHCNEVIVAIHHFGDEALHRLASLQKHQENDIEYQIMPIYIDLRSSMRDPFSSLYLSFVIFFQSRKVILLRPQDLTGIDRRRVVCSWFPEVVPPQSRPTTRVSACIFPAIQ